MTLAEISRQVRTLESDDVDVALAEREMRQSPLYRNLLVNSQGDTTAMQVNLVTNQTLRDLIDSRDKLYDKATTIPDAQQRLAELTTQIKIENRRRNSKIERTIAEVRQVMDGFRADATLYLGGVPMIASDSISFIRSDLKVFGVGVVVFIVVILLVSFKSLRWVVLPLGGLPAERPVDDGLPGLGAMAGDRGVFEFYFAAADHHAVADHSPGRALSRTRPCCGPSRQASSNWSAKPWPASSTRAFSPRLRPWSPSVHCWSAEFARLSISAG